LGYGKDIWPIKTTCHDRAKVHFWKKWRKKTKGEGQADSGLPEQQHSFNSLISMATWVRQYQKGKTIVDFKEARNDWVWGWQWHQPDCVQIICTLLQTDHPANTSSLRFSQEVAIKQRGCC